MRLRDKTQDAMVFTEAYWHNEYRLPEKFSAQDVIVDIGAHIGCFALACLDRGAGKVICFEPGPDNFKVLAENMAAYPAAEVNHAAVWRSDIPQSKVGFFLAPAFHTAQHFVGGGVKGDFDVRAASLDDILAPYERVRLLKLDCEGSEYPILYTSQLLRRCEEIVGECHTAPWMNEIGLDHATTLDGLLMYLKGRNYDVWSEGNGGNANFFAKRC